MLSLAPPAASGPTRCRLPSQWVQPSPALPRFKADLVTSLGAEHVIDYTRENFDDGEHRYDVVLAVGGMTSLSHLRRALTPKGTLVIVRGESDSKWSPGMGRQLRVAVLSPFVAQPPGVGAEQGALLRPRTPRRARRRRASCALCRTVVVARIGA